MKRFALMVVAVLALATPALAQVGSLGLYSDAQGNNCNLTDNGGGSLLNVYVVHTINPPDQSTGVRFKLVPPPGSNWILLTFVTSFTATGTADTDLSVGYGPCTTSTVTVGYGFYQSVGASPPCGYVNIAPGFPGEIIGADCNFAVHTMPTPGQMIANPVPLTCECNVATQASTWGQVKALYR